MARGAAYIIICLGVSIVVNEKCDFLFEGFVQIWRFEAKTIQFYIEK